MIKSVRSRLEAKLDKIVSRITRLGATDREGNITCYTCGKKKNWKEANCAHFIERTCRFYRRDLKNLEACCVYCNKYNKQEHMRVYTIKKTRELGIDVVQEMQNSKKRVMQVHTYEIEEMIEEMKPILKKIEEEKKFVL